MSRWLVALGGLVLWGLAAPLVFTALYSVIEIQGAARASATGDGRLADLQVVGLARDLQKNRAEADAIESQLNGERAQLAKVLPLIDAAKIKLDQNRGVVRAETLELAARYGLPITQAQCVAPAEVLGQCAHKQDDSACAADWQLATSCYYRLMASAGTPGLRGDAGFETALEGLSATMTAARDAGYAYNGYAKAYNAALARTVEAKGSLEALDPTKLAGPQNGQMLGVAQAYLVLNRVPLLVKLFLLPPGVSVALFTALMGALGALVGALSSRFSPASPKSPAAHEIAFVKPALGGMAGFTVFFVVSAGAAFLVQPGAKGAADAVNSLSAPALASLGIFAGLAADSAIEWLKTRAAAFFKAP